MYSPSGVVESDNIGNCGGSEEETFRVGNLIETSNIFEVWYPFRKNSSH